MQENREKSTAYFLERPLSQRYAGHRLCGDRLMRVPLMPWHAEALYKSIFSQQEVMKYFAYGQAYSWTDYQKLHTGNLTKNMVFDIDPLNGNLKDFVWTLVTHQGIAGRLNIFQTEGRTEVGFCIDPSQRGRSLAQIASEHLIADMAEDTRYIATAHPSNLASLKTIERIRYPDNRSVFFAEKTRQGVERYGPGQTRNYYLSA